MRYLTCEQLLSELCGAVDQAARELLVEASDGWPPAAQQPLIPSKRYMRNKIGRSVPPVGRLS